MAETIISRVRGNTPFASPASGTGEQSIDSRGDLLIAQGLPERADIVRLGRSWSGQILDANAFTLLITIPTTLAGLSLQNGEALGGASYIIDRVWCKCVTSTAAANYLTILGQVVPRGTALVAHSALTLIQSLSAKTATYNGLAQLAVASTATGAIANKWMPLGAPVSLPTSTSIAAFVEANINGRIIIPPQANLSLTAQEAVSGGTALLGVEWHEVDLVLG